MIQHFVILCIASCITFTAHAFERTFPDNAKRAVMSSLSTYPTIVLDKQQRTLAVGARIWNPNNMIEMPAYIQGTRLTVNYTEDMHGDIDRIWILSPAEIKKTPRLK